MLAHLESHSAGFEKSLGTSAALALERIRRGLRGPVTLIFIVPVIAAAIVIAS